MTRTGHVTALHRAAYCGHCSVIQLLLKFGALTSLCDADGKTALHKVNSQNSLNWATVCICKMVRPMLLDRCLSVCNVGCIRMPLGMEVDLSPDHIVLDSDLTQLPTPNFRPMSVVAKQLDGSRSHLVWR